MNKKKILIVGRTFYPEQSPRSFRTTQLAKELAKQGHKVDVLLPKNLKSGIESNFNNIYKINFLYYGPLVLKTLQKSKISWIGDWKRKFGRLLFLFFEYPNIEIYFKLPKVLKQLKGYDLMVSIAVPHENHWSIAAVRSIKNPIAKIWVADCGDPFMGITLESIKPPFYFKYLEKRFCTKANFISVPTEGAKNGYYKKFHSKIVVIPQGFDFEEFLIEKSEVKNDVVTFAYAGSVANSGIRSPKKIIEYLLKLNIPFQFHIYSGNAHALKELALQSPESIFLHEAIPRVLLFNELSKMDFLLNLDNGTSNQTPSKLIDYTLVGKPILNITADEFDTKVLSEFMHKKYTNQLFLDDIEQFNIKNVVKKFLELGSE
jgi:glycosyltransferase involved in cell wall biosynthesis